MTQINVTQEYMMFLLEAYLAPDADLPFTTAAFLVTRALRSGFTFVRAVFIRDSCSIFSTAPYIT